MPTGAIIQKWKHHQLVSCYIPVGQASEILGEYRDLRDQVLVPIKRESTRLPGTIDRPAGLSTAAKYFSVFWTVFFPCVYFSLFLDLGFPLLPCGLNLDCLLSDFLFCFFLNFFPLSWIFAFCLRGLVHCSKLYMIIFCI